MRHGTGNGERRTGSGRGPAMFRAGFRGRCVPRLRVPTRGLALAVGLALVGGAPLSLAAQERGGAALGQAVGALGSSMRVLIIGAHPDDEDTQLIAWLAKRAHAEVAYLSLTRGDGGQNIIGSELGEGLGVIRTEELLAARRVDGGGQYFTRAYDFGFSKSAEETFQHWPRDTLLTDVVTVVRVFRPHVIVSVFSGTPRDGHGQHQVAGLLAREAFDVAGDSVRFPRARTAGHPPWTVTKLYRGARFSPELATLRINVGEYDPLLGRSYAEIAGESRSQHKSQEFGNSASPGVAWDHVRLEATRAPAAPVGGERSLFDGVDTTWTRFRTRLAAGSARAALDSLPGAIARVSASLDLSRPVTDLRALVALSRLTQRLCASPRLTCAEVGGNALVSTLPSAEMADADRSLATLSRRVATALRLAAAVEVVATVERATLARGDSIAVDVAVYNRGKATVRLRGFSVDGSDAGRARREDLASVAIAPDSALRWRYWAHGARDTQPWWLSDARQGDLFGPSLSAIVPGASEAARAGGGVSDLAETGRAPSARVTALLEYDQGVFSASAAVAHRRSEFIRGETRRPLFVAPLIAITVGNELQVARAGVDLRRDVRVRLRSAAADTLDVVVALKLPDGLRTPAPRRSLRLLPGATMSLDFVVTGRLAQGRHLLSATATARGAIFHTGYSSISYLHLRPQLMYRDAAIALQAIDVNVPAGLTVGYIPGGSDNVAPVLQQLGIPLTIIEPASLRDADLSRYTAIVVGPRAYESQIGLEDAGARALAEHNERLLDFAARGGALVVQYGQYELLAPGIMPYPITINRPHDRVTIEDAPVRLLDETAQLLRYPNRITSADFAGWVQERALYMPRTFAPEYAALLEMTDPGEPPKRSAVLVALLGKGIYVHTSLAFFRQLPAGVPGATRLFVNLLSAQPASGGGAVASPATPESR